MRRASTRVALVLLGAAGVVGVATMIDAIRKAREASGPAPAPQPAPASNPISATQTYANNDYVPGVGYYHAPYHAWHPYPFNYHDPMRGYFAGGLWAAAPYIVSALRSQPSNDAVLAAQRAWEDRQRAQQQQQASNFSGGGYGYRASGSSGFFSRAGAGSAPSFPAPASAPAHGSTIRGGFGSSAHGAGAGE